MSSVDERANEVGRGQYGLITRRQLRAAGIGPQTVRRRLDAGRWTEPLPTVIDLGIHGACWEQAAMRLVLASGDRALLSHQTAAFLHGFVDFSRPVRIDVLVDRVRHDSVGSVRLHTSVRILTDERTEVDGLPCTSEARTWVDLAGLLTDEHLELVSYDLVRRRPSIRAEARTLLERRKGAPGRVRLLELLEAIPDGLERTESPLEADGVRALLDAGLPPPQLQFEIRDATGGFVHRADAAWPTAKVLIAFDGRRWHDTPLRQARDRAQRQRLRELGWTVIVVHREDLRGSRLEALVAQLRGLLRAVPAT